MSMMMDPSAAGMPDMEDSGGGGANPLELYKAMKELLREAIDVEQDEEDILALEKIATLVQQLLANNQKMQDSAMQGQMDPKMMRKAYSGGVGQSY